jgi:hypothetical protein
MLGRPFRSTVALNLFQGFSRRPLDAAACSIPVNRQRAASGSQAKAPKQVRRDGGEIGGAKRLSQGISLAVRWIFE